MPKIYSNYDKSDNNTPFFNMKKNENGHRNSLIKDIFSSKNTYLNNTSNNNNNNNGNSRFIRYENKGAGEYYGDGEEFNNILPSNTRRFEPNKYESISKNKYTNNTNDSNSNSTYDYIKNLNIKNYYDHGKVLPDINSEFDKFKKNYYQEYLTKSQFPDIRNSYDTMFSPKFSSLAKNDIISHGYYPKYEPSKEIYALNNVFNANKYDNYRGNIWSYGAKIPVTNRNFNGNNYDYRGIYS